MHTDLNIEKNDVFVLGLIMLELNIFKSVKHVNNDINIKNELLQQLKIQKGEDLFDLISMMLEFDEIKSINL